MEDSNNNYIYEQQDENEDQMFVIGDADNVNMENFQNYNIVNGNNEVFQLQDADGRVTELTGNQYIYFNEESGETYIVDPDNAESNNGDCNNNNSLVTYVCPLCKQVYQNANAFTKHMREKHFVKVFTCRQCEEFFDNLSFLFLHARRTHVDPKKPTKNPSSYKFHCSECNYMTNNGGTMEHHQRAHSGIKPYICDICQKSFAQKANMKTHRNRHIHKDRIFRCDVCNKSFNSHDIYLAHLRTREHELQEHSHLTSSSKIQIQCLGCNEQFFSYFEVNNHSRSCEILKKLTDKFHCVPCKADFSSSVALKGHLKGHGGNEIITCPVCGERGFPGFNQLNHHITRAHALKVNRRNVCRYCEMTFEGKEELTDHIEKMHSCEKNARQSRGTAGRLRCRYKDCDFTSNSVMQMDRHHDQHVSNTLPSTTKRVVKRPKKVVGKDETVSKEFMWDIEGMEDTEIEHYNSTIDADEVLRMSDQPSRIVKLEMLEQDDDDEEDVILEESHSAFDEMDIDDLKDLAVTYFDPMAESSETAEDIRKKQRGRPRKLTQRESSKQESHYENTVKNENFDISHTFDDSPLDGQYFSVQSDNS